MIDRDAVIAIVEGLLAHFEKRARERIAAELCERLDRISDDEDVPLLGETDVSQESTSVFDLA